MTAEAVLDPPESQSPPISAKQARGNTSNDQDVTRDFMQVLQAARFTLYIVCTKVVAASTRTRLRRKLDNIMLLRWIRKARRYLRLVAACFVAWPTGACASKESRIDPGGGSGHLILLPGVEGNAWQLTGVRAGLRDAGLDWTIEIIPWGSPPLSSLRNLIDHPANLARAKRIASRLIELRAINPEQPLVLCGYSGGGGLAIMTAEALPPDVAVDRIVLVAAAISNDFDLAQIEDRYRDKMVNIYSPRDGVVGWGTRLFGTIDRKKTHSAGHSGFLDIKGKLRVSDKLEQIEWSAEWRASGHGGEHTGYLRREWAKSHLAPIIRGADLHPVADSLSFESLDDQRPPGRSDESHRELERIDASRPAS